MSQAGDAGARKKEIAERLQLLIESVEDYAIFTLDVDGRVASWNKGAERFKGYTADEIIGLHFSTFYPEEQIAAGKPELELAVATATGRFEDEGWRLRKDGTRFWANVIITALRGEDGRLRGFGKVTRDLTERRRAEQELRQSEERLRLMIDSVSDYAIFMLDPGGHIMSWNNGANRLKGYRAEEIIGQHFSRFYSEEDKRDGKPERELEIAIRDGRVEDEGWRIRKDGSRFWANVVITALFSGGELRGFGKVTRDLTDRKQNEDALRGILQREQETAIRLRELDHMKNEFVAIVAHDLRSPITAVRGFAELLLKTHATQDLAQQRTALEAIERNASALSALIDDILEVSQIESGEMRVQKVPFDVAPLLSRVTTSVVSGGSQRVSIEHGELPQAFADEHRLWQVLTNLLSNALKFSEPDDPVELRATADDAEITISVKDKGVGIAKDDLPRLFQRFSRVGAAEKGTGTGLGLYICKRLVEAQGGRIWVESTPGLGSTFSFTIPRAETVPATRT